MSLVEGALGALIALLGLFLVFVLTRRHERERDALDRAATERHAWESRLDELVAGVADASHNFRGLSDDPTDDTRECSNMARGLQLLALHLITREREVSDWAMEEANTFVQFAHQDSLDPRAPSWEAGRVTGVLMQWRAGELPSSSFSHLTEGLKAANARQGSNSEKRLVELQSTLSSLSAEHPEQREWLAGILRVLEEEKDRSAAFDGDSPDLTPQTPPEPGQELSS